MLYQSRIVQNVFLLRLSNDLQGLFVAREQASPVADGFVWHAARSLQKKIEFTVLPPSSSTECKAGRRRSWRPSRTNAIEIGILECISEITVIKRQDKAIANRFEPGRRLERRVSSHLGSFMLCMADCN